MDNFEKDWEGNEQEIEKMVKIIQEAIGGVATYWATLIAIELLRYYQPKINKDSVVLSREEFLNLTPKRKKILANRVYEDSTLMTWKKSDLIEHIRVLEQNWIGSLKTIDIQAKNCEMLLKQASKETAEKILNELNNLVKNNEDFGRGIIGWKTEEILILFKLYAKKQGVEIKE